MKRAIVFAVVLLALGGATYGIWYFHFTLKPQIIRQAISGHAPPATTVGVAEATADRWTPRVTAIGTFRPVQGIEVAPQVGGLVRALHFDSGQEVAKGASLVEIDDSTEQADLKSGLAQMKNAEAALSRQEQLVAGGATARATVDQAQATRDTAAASVDRARAVIAQKDVVAPFAGRLGLRKVDVGQYVSPGTAMVTLTQLDPVYVDFPVTEQQLATLKTGAEVEIRVDAYPDATFKGEVRSIDARVSQDSRSILVRAELPNADKRLLPGMFANVAVVSGAPRDVVTVPRTGVTYSLYGDSLYVAKPAPAGAGEARAAGPLEGDFIAERRFVRTGEVHGDRIAVLEGVKPGELVIAQGQIKLQPDAHVRIDPGGALPSRPALPRQ